MSNVEPLTVAEQRSLSMLASLDLIDLAIRHGRRRGDSDTELVAEIEWLLDCHYEKWGERR